MTLHGCPDEPRGPDPDGPDGTVACVAYRVLAAEEDGGGLQGWNNNLAELAEEIARAIREEIGF